MKVGSIATTIAFTGGGTGGHIYPGLAVIAELRTRGFSGRIAWIGSDKESDRSVVEGAGVEYLAIPSGKLRRNLSLENAADAFRVLAGYSTSLKVLKTLRPSLLFSKGGYVSVPPCAAAARLGIPYFTHESDLSPGLATRLNATRAERILVSYEETRGLLPAALRGRVFVAGNPVRPSIRGGDANAGRKIVGAPAGKPIVLFLGGSQGAKQVNELALAVLPGLADRAYVVHQTGETAGGAAAPDQPGRYRSYGYIRDEMPHILAAADLVVGRAGAGTLWECAALGKPMVLVPLCGSGTRGDQVDNARLFAAKGAAIVLVGAEASPGRLLDAICDFLENAGRLGGAGAAARGLAGADAAGTVAKLILDRLGGCA
jgi:UDP-N-acetylglucosamine--N-acetylmuramyl-(pentapeptide) pyrophosphoryl-undecaprenol N-acetylglucosamine transferase